MQNNKRTSQDGINRRAEESKCKSQILGDAGTQTKANRTLAKAASLSYGVRGNNVSQNGFSKELFLAYLEVTDRQDGTWIENIKSIAPYKYEKRGQEAEIYLSKDGRYIIKLNRFTLLDENHGIEEFIDRIESHNLFEPFVQYNILGFAEDSLGEVCAVMGQPIIKGEEATQEQIDSFLIEMGYEKLVNSECRIEWSNGIFTIWDTESKNVLFDAEGNIYFIDAVINSINFQNAD